MLFVVAAWLPSLHATTWYVNGSATGPTHNGTTPTTAWQTFAAIQQSELSGGDVVLIFPGNYNEVFVITKSGTSANARITYKGTGSSMPVLYGINGAGPFKNTPFNYIAVIGLQLTQPDSSYGLITSSNPSATNTPGVGLRGSTGWLIQDNYFFQTYGPPIDLHSGTVNNYNIIRGNRFDQIGYVPAMNYYVGNDIIVLYGDHNVVEYNTFGIGEHRIYTYSTETIIRNNLDTGTNETLFPTSNSPVPGHEHIDDVHGGYALANSLNFSSAQNFIERNFWADNAGQNGHNNIFQDDGFDGSGTTATGLTSGIVIRQNVNVRTGSAFLETDEGTLHTRVYNNTIVTTLNASANSNYNATVSFFPPQNQDVDCRNNIYYDTNFNHLNSAAVIDSSNVTGFTEETSDVFGNGSLSFGTGNLISNPQFNNVADDDYTLKDTSPMEHGAAFLTTTAAAGSGTTLLVTDATGFCDGFNITGGPEGDFIKVGSNPYVQITAVNYAGNTLTLASSITWNIGDPIIVKGMEDIGALPSEYVGTPTVTNTTTNNLAAITSGTVISLTASTTTPDAVRRIDFLVDGIPVGSAYEAPYSVSWTADGLNHIVESRAYNAWASKTDLWVSDFNNDIPTPTPTPLPSRLPTPTPRPSPTRSPSPTPGITPTPTPTRGPTPTPRPTPTPVPSPTPGITPTPTPTRAPTPTPRPAPAP